MLHRDSLYCVATHALCEAPLQPVTPLYCVSIAAKSSRAQLAPFAPWGIKHHPHIRLSLGHGSDTLCKNLGHHPKRQAF